MPLYDISLTISKDLPVWPGDPAIELEKIAQIDQGDQANVTHISTAVHIGTHVDAPDHFLNNGKTVEDIPLEYLVGPVLVVEIDHPEAITSADLADLEIPVRIERILFKTRNSNYWKAGEKVFQENFVALSPGAAEALVKIGIKVIGIDYLSVAAFSDPGPTHKILLEGDVLIIEGLDLSNVEPGEYRLYCLPIKITGSDGAPARVLLEN